MVAFAVKKVDDHGNSFLLPRPRDGEEEERARERLGGDGREGRGRSSRREISSICLSKRKGYKRVLGPFESTLASVSRKSPHRNADFDTRRRRNIFLSLLLSLSSDFYNFIISYLVNPREESRNARRDVFWRDARSLARSLGHRAKKVLLFASCKYLPASLPEKPLAVLLLVIRVALFEFERARSGL